MLATRQQQIKAQYFGSYFWWCGFSETIAIC